MDLNDAHFQETLTYQREADAAALLADLDRIGELDAVAEQLQRRWMIFGVVAIAVPGIVAFSLASGEMIGAAVAAGAVGLVAAIYCFVQYKRYRRQNVDDRRYMLTSKLVELLRVDLAPDATVQTKVDLRPVDDKSKLERQGQVGAWKVRFFRDPWLQLSGRLLDGTSFELSQTDLHQARSKRKRSRSGKIKFKSKTKSAFEAELRLRFKPAKYRHMATLKADAEQAVQLPQGVTMKRLRYSDRELGLRVTSKSSWCVRGPEERVGRGIDATRALSLMFLSLYQILNLSKAIQKSAAAGDAGNGESA